MYELKEPKTASDWQKYHEIRRKALFEERGRGEVYDEKHEDDRKEGNYPLILFYDGEIVGSIRIDVMNAQDAATRLVAIKKEERGRRHGQTLLALAEQFIKEKGRSRIVVNAAPEALEFYRREGFFEKRWDAEELNQPGAADCIQMVKKI